MVLKKERDNTGSKEKCQMGTKMTNTETRLDEPWETPVTSKALGAYYSVWNDFKLLCVLDIGKNKAR